jgi:iron complex outermembrane receptor protein
MRKTALLLATAASVVAAWSVPALAENTRDSGDIIVTARRRQESILNVPVVASVLNENTIQQRQVTDIRSITANVPGLITGNSVGSIGTQISLRGVGTSALDAGIDQSVSLNIDGQQFSQGLTFKSGLFDMQQIEVLKGPQALFFGKNSPGGVIAVTTADPGKEVEVIGRFSYEFEGDEPRAELILSGPVTDTLGVRLAGAWDHLQGYFHNTAVAAPGFGGVTPHEKRAYGNENWIVRGTVVWEPAPNFKARLKVNVTHDHSNSPIHLQNVSCPSGTGPSTVVNVNGVPAQMIGGPIRCTQDRNIEVVDMDPAIYNGRAADGSLAMQNGGVPFDTIRQQFGVLDLIYHANDDVTLTSTSTYYRNVTDNLFNGTTGGEAGTPIYAQNHFNRHDFTQEVRIESDYKDKPVNWLLGGFYQSADMYNSNIVGANTLYPIPVLLKFNLPGILTAGFHKVTIDSISLFGQARWKPVSRLEIAFGARWTSERRTDTPYDTGTFVQQMTAPVLVSIPHPEISSKNISPELTITYTPTDDLTIFGALKQGYKSGSYSITTPAETGVDNSFGDERVRGGEIGLKSRLLDRSLNVNIAGYYYRYNGLQVGVSQPAGSTGIPTLVTLNAGSAEVYGIDFDASYRPPAIENLNLNLAVNWNKAKFLKLDNVPCWGGQTIALGCNQSFDPTKVSFILPAGAPGSVTNPGLFTGTSASGEPLEKAPQWQIIAGFDYDLPVSDNMRFAFGSSLNYASSYKSVIGNRPDYYQREAGKINAYVTLKDSQDRWEVSVIGSNLNDVLRAGYCANSDFQNSTVYTGSAQVNGSTINPTGKIDDVGCVVDPGRQVFLKLTLRPMGLFH